MCLVLWRNEGTASSPQGVYTLVQRQPIYKSLKAQGASAGAPLTARLVGGKCGCRLVVRKALRWRSRLSSIHKFGEDRAGCYRKENIYQDREAAKGNGSMRRCQPRLGFHGAWVRSRMSALPLHQHPLRSFLEIQMPEPNPQRVPVLWSGGGERTLIRTGKKKGMANHLPELFLQPKKLQLK